MHTASAQTCSPQIITPASSTINILVKAADNSCVAPDGSFVRSLVAWPPPAVGAFNVHVTAQLAGLVSHKVTTRSRFLTV
jgi:hypothetical protein